MSWLIENKEWLFSGAGVAVLVVVVPWLFRKFSHKSDSNSRQLASANVSQADSAGANVHVQQAGRDFVINNPPNVSPPAPEVEDKWLSDLDYIEDVGIAERLRKQGYRLYWSGADTLSRRVDIDGWEVVVDTDDSGKKVRYKIRDESVGGYLILLKKKEPTTPPAKATKEPSKLEKLEQQMPDLFAEMRTDLRGDRFIREFVVMKSTWSFWADENNPTFFYYFDKLQDLMGKLGVLENHGLVTDVTCTNVKRYRMSEELAQYLIGENP